MSQAASELGLEPSVLRHWRRLANQAGQAGPAVQTMVKWAQMERDVLRSGFHNYPGLS